MYMWFKSVQDFAHQLYVTQQIYLVKDLFKNLKEVLGGEKYASTTYGLYI